MSILLGVRPEAVAVLEVDSVVLNRFTLEFVNDALVNPLDQFFVALPSDKIGECSWVWRVGSHGLKRHRTERRGYLRLEEVRTAINRVDGLAFRFDGHWVPL